MSEFKVGDKVWYIGGQRLDGLIAILCTITELDDYFNKKDPKAYIFYHVDEPTGHSLADDELILTREEAEDELLNLAEEAEEYEPGTVKQDVDLEEWRKSCISFIMETWKEVNPVWTVKYPNKKENEEWFNLEHLQSEIKNKYK